MNLIVRFSMTAISFAFTLLPSLAQNSQVSAMYRVSGWQSDLVQSSPNLRNYYWEPMTHRVINTTRTTGRGAVQVAMPVVAAERRKNRLAVAMALPVNAAQTNSAPAAHVPESFKNSRTSYKRIADLQTSSPMTYPEVSTYSGDLSVRRSISVRGRIARP